jgi:hypothetical protein
MPTRTEATRVYISFDYDHDEDVKTLLVGQSRKRDTPFSFEDWSIKEETKGWKADARRRIKRCACVIVVCGHHTHRATGVADEIAIAREEGIPFWLLKGRKNGLCRRPQGTSFLWDTLHEWSWKNIETMCGKTPEPWWKRMW